MIDLAAVQDALNGLKQAPVSELSFLVSKAIDMETLAQATANLYNLPGEQTRANLLTKLHAHAAALAAEPDQTAIVVDPALATVKADVTSAAVDLNSVTEGVQYNQAAAAQLFEDIVVSARNVFSAIASGAASIATWGTAAIYVGLAVGSVIVVVSLLGLAKK